MRDPRMRGKCSITNGANIIKCIAVHISRIRQESLKIVDGKQSEEARMHMKPNIYEKAPGNTSLDTAGMLTTKGKLKKHTIIGKIRIQKSFPKSKEKTCTTLTNMVTLANAEAMNHISNHLGQGEIKNDVKRTRICI